MKEFAIKHPILTFFLADSIVCGVVKIVAMITGYHGPVVVATTNKEDSEDEPANDTQ